MPSTLQAEAARPIAPQSAECVRRVYRTPERLTLRAWAERYRLWPDESPYRVDETPHIAELMDAYSDPTIEEIVALKPTQSGATEGLMLNAVGYHMDQDPRAILAVIPSVDEAEKWSKKKLRPMVDSSPRLRNKLEDGSRKASNTILEKSFPGGSLGIIGSNSGRGFRMVTIGRVLADDVDGWDSTAGSGAKNEGDQVTLLRRRADRVEDRKLVWISTPTYVGARIDTLYHQMARRGRFHVPCPHCGEMQPLLWGGPDTAYGIKWEREKVEDGYVVQPGEVLRGKTVHRPQTAYYLCRENSCVIEESDKSQMAAAGEYLTDDGEPVRRPGYRSVGYRFNALVLTLPGAEWPRLVEEFLTICDDPDALRAFWNLVLAEPWEDRTDQVDPDTLEARKADYGAEVPEGVGVLTAFVDVQKNRLELQVQGWGIREESWVIRHVRIYGDPERDEVWDRLEGLRTSTWTHASGRKMRIEAMGVDASYLTKQVFKYVKGKGAQKVYAFDGQGGKRSYVLQRPRKLNRDGVRPWKVAVNAFKDVLFRRLRIQRPGPGYLHFVSPPDETDEDEGRVIVDTGMDSEYFAQSRGEEVRWERSAGQLRRRYHQTGPNEFIDLHVGCMAALHTLPAVGKNLPRWVKEASAGVDEADEDEEEPDQKDEAPARTVTRGRRRGGWVDRWR